MALTAANNEAGETVGALEASLETAAELHSKVIYLCSHTFIIHIQAYTCTRIYIYI
jgi:hypothetical protein